jgi:GDPmannose 4,6-dehydratase
MYDLDCLKVMWLIPQDDWPGDDLIATGGTNSVREFLEQAFPHVAFGYHDHGMDLRYDRSADVDLVIGDASKAKKMLG